jgi:hypothetical protein
MTCCEKAVELLLRVSGLVLVTDVTPGRMLQEPSRTPKPITFSIAEESPP